MSRTATLMQGGRRPRRIPAPTPPPGQPPPPPPPSPPPPADDSPIWERVAGMCIGRKDYTTDSYQTEIARAGLAIIGPYRNQYTDVQLVDMLQGIKDKNPNLLLGHYTNIVEVLDSLAASNASADVYQKCIDQNWMLKTVAGALVTSGIQPPKKDILFLNAYTTPDSNGRRMPQWQALRDYLEFFEVAGDLYNIWYFDNSNRRTRQTTACNWKRDGVDRNGQTDTSLVSAYRTGHAVWWAACQVHRPDIELYGNPDLSNDSVELCALSHPEYTGRLDGAFAESYIGVASSPDTSGGWTRLMSRYQDYMANLRGPKRATINCKGTLTDYQRMRYGLATTFLLNGYFCFTDTAVSYGSVPRFDEYYVPLGQPIDTGFLSQGTHRYRRYDGGMVVVNTSTSTASAFDATAVSGGPWFSFDPTETGMQNQQPSINNGLQFTSRTLAAKDGRILVRS